MEKAMINLVQHLIMSTNDIIFRKKTTLDGMSPTPTNVSTEV